MLKDYNLEMKKVIKNIKDKKAKVVCIQLPDGFKPYADKITLEIEEKTKAKVLIWAASCFGACDIPPIDKSGVDLLIQWGHSEWTFHS